MHEFREKFAVRATGHVKPGHFVAIPASDLGPGPMERVAWMSAGFHVYIVLKIQVREGLPRLELEWADRSLAAINQEAEAVEVAPRFFLSKSNYITTEQ
jgi:hypothetical protein